MITETAVALDKILEIEEKGLYENALMLMDDLINADPTSEGELVYEKGKMCFRNGLYVEALLNLIRAYELLEDESVVDIIKEAYYQPNIDFLQKLYNDNLKALENYEYVYINDVKNEITPVLVEDDFIVVYHESEKRFYSFRNPKFKSEARGIPFFENMIFTEELISYVNGRGKTDDECLMPNYEVPIYCYYDELVWQVILKTRKMKDYLSIENVIVVEGKNNLDHLIIDEAFHYPEILISQFGNDLGKVFEDIAKRLSEKEKRLIEVVQEEYKEYSYYESVIRPGKKPKVLIITSRYTTVLQNHARDTENALKRMGCEAEIYMEGRYQQTSFNRILEMVVSFKPDIVFILDHFRFELGRLLPDNIIVLSYIQDPLPRVMDMDTPAKLLKNDFVLNHFTSWKEFKNINYSERCLIDAPIPANDENYRPMSLSSEERKKYGCDICFVCHAADINDHLMVLLRGFPDEYNETIVTLYYCYKELVYTMGKTLFRKEDYITYINEIWSSISDLPLKDVVLEAVAEDMYYWYNQRVFRQCLADWLIDAGYTNIKLWGNGWLENEKYKPYAMGPAENGETLSKIYQASKIVIGNNTATTAAARAWESMLSGAFYLANYIPPEEDYTDIRRIMRPEELVMFNGRDDLLKKVEYYLANEDERKKMAEIGRKVALEKMTFESTMSRVLNTVSERISEEYN